jgi:hypothetical protein
MFPVTCLTVFTCNRYCMLRSAHYFHSGRIVITFRWQSPAGTVTAAMKPIFGVVPTTFTNSDSKGPLIPQGICYYMPGENGRIEGINGYIQFGMSPLNSIGSSIEMTLDFDDQTVEFRANMKSQGGILNMETLGINQQQLCAFFAHRGPSNFKFSIHVSTVKRALLPPSISKPMIAPSASSVATSATKMTTVTSVRSSETVLSSNSVPTSSTASSLSSVTSRVLTSGWCTDNPENFQFSDNDSVVETTGITG